MQTFYYLPKWWKHPMFRFYRRWKLSHWRKQRVYKKTKSPSPNNLMLVSEGMAIMTRKRTRKRETLVFTSRLSDYAIDRVLS